MSETVGAQVETPIGGAEASETIRVPRNVMSMLRQSYDSREKVLDWLLAFAVVGCLVYIFRDQLRACLWPLPSASDGPNAGRTDNSQPNQNVAGAFPQQAKRPELFTYNMPSSRHGRYGVGPSGTRPPDNPSNPPVFPTMADDLAC